MRVPLHGRRVRGWVVADDVVPEVDAGGLHPLTGIVSAGPPPEVVALCEWAAWRWAGSVVPLLRAASPPAVVAPDPEPELRVARYPSAPLPGGLAPLGPRSVVAWPPAADRLALARALLAPEGSTIVLVPDAGRVRRLVEALRRDGRHVVDLRSDRTARERAAAWADARAGACVVVGGRVAALAPVPDVRALVVLDEGDEALKEERAPTWSGRDVAAERAARAGARLTLVGPVPTLDAARLAGAPVRPERAVERAGWPILEVVDQRAEAPGAGLLTRPLTEALHRALDAGGRAVVVLNRTGRARLLVCRTCRELARCETCAVAVLQRDEAELTCPRCGTTRPRVCAACGSTALRVLRPGVAHLRDDLAGIVPRATVAEVHGAAGEAGVADVYVGTEAVLHRVPPGPRVRLVAFPDVDQELLAPRHRAAEQAALLLARAARLLGGRGDGGRLLVQTRVPHDAVLEAVLHADPTGVADAERPLRAQLGLPPFGGLAELRGDEAAVAAAAAALPDGVSVLGPSGGRALARAASAAALADALATADLGPARARGRLRVDVDPVRA